MYVGGTPTQPPLVSPVRLASLEVVAEYVVRRRRRRLTRNDDDDNDARIHVCHCAAAWGARVHVPRSRVPSLLHRQANAAKTRAVCTHTLTTEYT